ncbi:short chain dehydrogenase [Ceratobasidium sp. AG-Ba]|nr:short chain dehydrogenase [Ceratobasidium sp. AG-Ba]
MNFQLNEDGIEENMAVHHFGPFVFTMTVLDLMKQTSAKQGSDVRIVCVNSRAHNELVSPPIDFDDEEGLISKPYPPTNYNTFMGSLARCGRTKLANLLFAKELQRRLGEEGSNIIVLSLHPGTIKTDTALDTVAKMPIIGSVFRLIGSFMFTDEPTGALNTMFAATNPVVRAEAEKYKGKYLMPVGRLTAPSTFAQDGELAKRVWGLTEKVVKAKGGV